MSSPNLPDGAFFTTINGRRCTAIPKEGAQRTTATPPAETPTPPPVVRPPTPTPPVADTPPVQEPDINPPVRDPPQAEEPVRQTPPVNPPPATTASTQTPPSPSSPRAGNPLPTLAPAPIRTQLPPIQASQIQDPIFRPPSPGIPDLPSPSPSPSPPPLVPPVADIARPSFTSETRPPAASGSTPDESLESDDDLQPPLFPSQRPISASISDSESPAAETSRTDEDNAAPSQGGQNTPEADLSTPPLTDGEPGSLVTTAPFGPGTAESDQAATSGSGFGNIPAGISDGGSGPSGPPVGAIVGGVVGGVAFLTMLALLLWFWRKNRRHRRSTLLTPLGTDESGGRFGRKERPYIFDQESVGPTPKTARFRAALGYNIQRVKGQVGGVFTFGHHRSPSGSVLSKGNAYTNITGHSRDNSLASIQGLHASGALTTKERLTQWKERFGALAIFGGRDRQDKPMDPDPFAGVREKRDGIPAAEAGQAPPTGSQADFLTLLGMDEKAVAREAHRRRSSQRQGSTASMERFLGDLGINIDNNANPFGDANALPDEPRRATPANPFSDKNAIPSAPPATAMAMKPGANYIADVRRSRNMSVSGSATRPPSTQAPHSPRHDSVYRASGDSVESFATRRNRCRSDPFDLDRPELLSGPSSRASASPRKPGAAHMRSESFASKYSSGVTSAAGWSEPGPDVGGAEAGVVGGRFSPNSGWRPGAFPGRQDKKRMSDESQGSQNTQKTVGKAM